MKLLQKVKKESEKNYFYLDLKKASILVKLEVRCVQNGRQSRGNRGSFIFLASKIEVSGEGEGEINRRLAMRRTARSGLTKIWNDKDVTIQT